MFYFATGDRTGDAVKKFGAEIADVMREHVGDNKRVAVDKIMIHGLRALEANGRRRRR